MPALPLSSRHAFFDKNNSKQLNDYFCSLSVNMTISNQQNVRSGINLSFSIKYRYRIKGLKIEG
jgi:hypothetical protein